LTPRSRKTQRTLNTVSLFTGAGGLDYGFEAGGFTTAAAVELDAECCSTLRASRLWPVLQKNIHEVSAAEICAAGALPKGMVDVLIGGPPCQPFSKSAYWANGDTRRLDDPRADTLSAYMRCVRDLQPKVFVLENVHGINYSGKEEGLLLLYRLTEAINRRLGCSYELSWKVINAADFGVPQIRTRFFLVGHREGERFRFPAPTHSSIPSADDSAFTTPAPKPWVTAWDAIGNLAPEEDEDLNVRGSWAELLPSIPEGENYLWHTNRKGGLPLFGWRTRYWSFLLKLAKNKPSWTIQAQPGPAIGPFHWENRLLSRKEIAALQTFPPTAKVIGARNAIQRQLGNAVPSLLAEVLAREIRRQFFGGCEEALKLQVLSKGHTPPPEPAKQVPRKYRYLAGKHPDHPGTGHGRRASNARSDGDSASQAHFHFADTI
jgi:DNA (cytosine-5)-methyltransferase 1